MIGDDRRQTSYHLGPLASFSIRDALRRLDCSEADAGSNFLAFRVRSEVRGIV